MVWLEWTFSIEIPLTMTIWSLVLQIKETKCESIIIGELTNLQTKSLSAFRETEESLHDDIIIMLFNLQQSSHGWPIWQHV